MIKLRSKKLFKKSSKLSSGGSGGGGAGGCGRSGDIEWELRPGGMLVQKREGAKCDREGVITVRVSTGSHWHDISIGATSTFAELKMIVAMVTGLEPREQRLLFRGKEREDGDHLHMVGVRDKDKVLLLEDPAIREMKLKGMTRSQVMGSPCHTIIEVLLTFLNGIPLSGILLLRIKHLSNMQSLSSYYSKGASLATPYLDSDTFPHYTLRKRRTERGVCGGMCGGSKFSHLFFLSSSTCGLTSSNLHPRTGFSANNPKLSFCESKMSPFGKYFALALALEQEPDGCEHVKEVTESEKPEGKEVSFDSSGGIGNNEICDAKDGEEEMVVDFEETARRDGAESVEKDRIDVRALAASLHDAKTADDVEELFKNLEILPLPVYSSMIRGLGSDKKLHSAFALVEWLKRKREDTGGSVGPNLFIYNSLLSAVKQTEQFDKVDEVMDDMKSQGIVPNIVTYNTLMSVYLEQGQPNEALDVLVDIENNGLSPSPVTYSTVLLAFKKMDDSYGALGYFVKLREQYEKGEVGKDKDMDWETEFLKLEKFLMRICYLVMRQWLVKEENPTANVLKLLSDMDMARVKPSRVECERLVWACTRESHYTVAKELYRRIREMDSDISLSVCNHLIWLMGKAKKWWAALEIYEDLLDKGPKPNNLSYELIISHFNILLTAARRRGIWRWGVRLLNKMQDKGLRPGTREWNAVLVACSKASETSAAVQIFRRMVEQGEKPTILSYGALLSALEKGKLYDEALQVWEHMRRVGVKPNLHAYTILVSVFIGKGSPDMVDSVLREMVSSGIEPNVVTYNAIITGCAKNKMGSAAYEWFHRMKVRKIKPNEITYEMLIKALAQDGKPRLAYEMYLRACNEGLHLSSKPYDAVLESCQAMGTSIDLNALGPRPAEKRKSIKIRKNLSNFCHFADVPRRGKPFDEAEMYSTQMQESQYVDGIIDEVRS
ncbi:protein LOW PHOTOSYNTHETIC EFFICIENCY 1, chloroplastic [Phoenix dactylifera]|uniref:Protein LOW PHOTOSYNTHETIC EFFICIENCY 1, chloroplastic n=1 Tax=Phoenix dactylifera TaxID=42345 RepID=A0A8B8JBI0_PHODC|nr:protein LOW PHOTOSYNTHETIC EFFICIENCY 1, chloroplastic [Phoenix dactylifera]